MSILLRKVVVGMFEANCYIVYDPEFKTCMVIDPGDEPEKILAELKDMKLPADTRYEILLTHAHFDHIRAVNAVAKALDAKVYLHPEDVELYQSPLNKMDPWVPAATALPPTEPFRDVEVFNPLHTPGHTPGGCSFYFPQIHALFSGDTLFAGSVGRTDFPGGDTHQLLKSIREVLFELPPNTQAFPGHGPETTLDTEKKYNPYLK